MCRGTGGTVFAIQVGPLPCDTSGPHCVPGHPLSATRSSPGNSSTIPGYVSLDPAKPRFGPRVISTWMGRKEARGSFDKSGTPHGRQEKHD